MFKVVIIGGEDFEDYKLYEEKCIKCLSKKGAEGCGIMIYTTGDKFNDIFARRFQIDLRYFSCDWKKNGNDAIKIRNEEMLSTADAAIIFDNNSKDIKFFLEMTKAKNIPSRHITKTI